MSCNDLQFGLMGLDAAEFELNLSPELHLQPSSLWDDLSILSSPLVSNCQSLTVSQETAVDLDPNESNPAITGGNSSTSSATSQSSVPRDSYLLPVTELKLLRGLLWIAGRLNAAQSVWNLAANSPFNLGTGPSPDQLPPTWQPTASQLLVPHHPLFDLLPWPRCRDRIINVMSLPEEEKPPMLADKGDGGMAIMSFICNMEDGAEGIRIWGDDPYNEQNWEVGQLVFERWWFIFDPNIIDRSNYWRRLRGASTLRTS